MVLRKDEQNTVPVVVYQLMDSTPVSIFRFFARCTHEK